MSNPHDVQELSAAATELYRQAELLEQNKTIRTKDAAEQLRAEARKLLLMAEKALNVMNGEFTASQKIDGIGQQADKLAKQIRYSPDILNAMREAGTIEEIARDLGMPWESLELHTAKAIIKNLDKAVRRRMVASWKGGPSQDEVEKADIDTIKRLLCMGVSSRRVKEKLGIDQKRIVQAENAMTKSERTQRTIAITAVRKKRHDKVKQLKAEGYKNRFIASRTGYTVGHVAGILAGKFKDI